MVSGALVGPVLTWFAATGRDLPWRRTRDPWAVLVAELMLQQTGVSRVVARYEAFLARFPTPAECAAAPVSDVVGLWRGLGYNRRAVALHRAADAVVAEHGGRLPADLGALLVLPGVGPYTARAVLAFAYEQPVGVLDVNVRRVLSRISGRPVDQETADEAVPPTSSWAWNQAVMELGATVCRPRPACERCPVAAGCAWAASDRSGPDPWRRDPRQSRFAGSDRQGRGRLVDALRSGPVAADDLAAVMGWPDDAVRAERVAATVVADGLARSAADGTWSLPV